MLKNNVIGNIYKITNPFNDKIYIGQTWGDLSTRCSGANRYKGCTKLYRAFIKYGFSNFNVEIIKTADTQKLLDKLEVHFIQEYDCINNGYNCKTGGSHGKHSEEAKKKISDANSGCGNGMYGRTHSEKTKKKMSLRKRGEGAPTAKLTWKKVAQIRFDFAQGQNTKHLADKYNVNTSTINRIVRYETWSTS